jgi:hypothetical protein
MGWFESKDDIKKKELVKNMQREIGIKGLSNLVDEKDYQKVLIEQNETMIALLSVIAIGQSGIAGDVVTIAHTSRYYDALSKIINK